MCKKFAGGEFPVPLLVINRELEVVDCNERARSDLPSLQGGETVPLNNLCPEEDWQAFRAACGRPPGEFKVRCRLFSRTHPQGCWHDLGCTWSDSGEQLFCVAHDIHEEVTNGQRITKDKAEAYLLMEQAQMARNRFLDIMSHELRTPLTAILGLSEALETGLYGDISEDQIEAVRTINGCGQTLLRLINDILDITKLETGKIETLIEPLAPHEICQSVLRLYAKAARETGVVLTTHCQTSDHHFLGDRKRMKQALSHLLDNAVKFSPRGGAVILKAHPDSETVRFEVVDEGPGISEEQLPELLASFSQSDQSLARPYNGAGLGLTLAKKLVDLMGGRLAARNLETGGACFSISMPAVSVNDNDRFSYSEVRGEGTVVLVDDHHATVKLLTDALKSWGFEVEVHNHAGSLQARPKTKPIRAILMDGKLPDGNGIDCIRWVREQPEYKDLPIVFLTASEGLEVKRAGMAAGASAFLEKPVKLSAIAHCLEYLL